MPNPKSQSDRLDELKKAGSDALVFNAPLSLERAQASISFVDSHAPQFVVDYGCGIGSYICLLLGTLPLTCGLGLDLDAEAVKRARFTSASGGLSNRLSFEVGDAAQYRGPVDVSICIGSAHVFGDTDTMFRALHEIQPSGVAVVGDGVWTRTPDDWCLSTFGNLPLGAEGLGAIAEENGWTVIDASVSSLDEWDEFEITWNRGVREVGTEVAQSFAARRAEDYQRYRGTLGFGWLYLQRR